MDNTEMETLLGEFLTEWPVDKVREMPLENYVVGGSNQTFCYWVETKAKDIGNIKGQNSFIFGIYKRKEKLKQYSGKYKSDGEYAWLSDYGGGKEEAFENVRNKILAVIDHSIKGTFSLIEKIQLHPFFKWKVAYLYSGQRLIPIYERAVLNNIAQHFGLKVTKTTKISEIQEVMIQNKPANLSSFEYTKTLWDKFGGKGKKGKLEIRDVPTKTQRRRSASELKYREQIRISSHRISIVEPKHVQLQLALREKLFEEFGKDSRVLFEENDVDVKLVQPNQIVFYEVKTSPFASDCIKAALGQLLSYAFADTDERKKKLVVVGQYPPNPDDKRFIEFIKKILRIEFEYRSVRLSQGSAV